MDGITTLFIIPILLIAFITVYSLSKGLRIDTPQHKYSSIDGLRGFLATFVFICHSSLWYFRTHPNIQGTGLDIFSNLGPAAVSYFFMITSFLFFSKLIEARSGKLDWLKLYVGRVTRIMPLYTVVVLILFTMVAIVSHFMIRESLPDLLTHAIQWMFFMEPDINQVRQTRLIIYGVQWSLAFEWMFYCSLPILGALFFRIRSSLTTILFSSFFLVIFLIIIFKVYDFRAWNGLLQFLGGLPAALLSKNKKVRALCSKSWMSAIWIVGFVFALIYFYDSIQIVHFIFISILFTGIACGNDMFGLLTTKICRQLGQISYSIYLVHGLVLFTTFYFVIGFNNITKMSLTKYWSIICLCTIPLIIVTCITFRFVEKRGIDSAKKITDRIKRLFDYESPSSLPKADS